MNWADKEIEEMARNAEANQQFAYNDSFWAEMEAMLPKKKRRIWPIVWLSTFVSLGFVAFLGYFSLNTKNANQPSQKFGAIKEYKVLKTGKSSISTPEFSDNGMNEKQQAATENKNQSASIYKVKEENLVSGFSSPGTSVRVGESFAAEIAENTTANQIISTIILKDKDSQSNEISHKNKVETIEIESNNANQNTENIAKENVGLFSIENLPFHPIAYFSAAQENNFIGLKMHKPRSFYAGYIELGAGLGQSYVTNQRKNTNFVNFGAGIRRTQGKVYAQIGLNVEAEKVGVNLTRRTRSYGLDINTFENNLSYKNLYRLNLPVAFGYTFAKQELNLGMAINYLMTTKMDYRYLENEKTLRNELLFGTKDGWKQFGLKANVGYGYRIFPSTILGATFQVQLLNQVDKNWSKSINNNPISGQIFVRKTIR